ncbi:MAG: hypothetical protein ACHQPH_02985 [Reyranellales bacterium]
MDRSDWALLAAYLLAAALGTWTRCLLVHDGAILLTAGWLGDAWDLYFSQNASRAVSTLLSFGPVWLVRRAFGPSAGTYMVLGHVFYFAMALVPWRVLRAIEPHRLFSRLYLAVTLAMIYFLAEVVFGVAFWLMWLAVIVRPARTTAQIALATLLLGIAMAFCHPVTGLMTLVYLVAGGVLVGLRRPFPRRTLVAGAALAVLLLLAYFAQSRGMAATNPTILNAVSIIRFGYIDPTWMAATMVIFPMLAALWLLLLVPGFAAAGMRLSRLTVILIAVFGLWFAAAGTGMLTWLYARHTAAYIVAVAAALALLQPALWCAEARRALVLYALVVSTAFVSYAVDLTLFGRFIDRYPASGWADVDRQPAPWLTEFAGGGATRIAFKWGAGQDYVRDMVVPTFDWYRLTLAFYTYFHSDRHRVLYHLVERPGDWKPYECPALARARALPHDATDLKFIDFLAEHYCPR